METFLCITHTDEVSDVGSLAYTKGMVGVLLHVGHVTLEIHLFRHSSISTQLILISASKNKLA